MVEELLSSGRSYALHLLDQWLDVIEDAQKFREALMRGTAEHELTFTYVSRLTRLWLELMPKIKDRKEFGDLTTRYMALEQYYHDPTLLLKPENAGDIFKIEEAIREAFERLKITDFEAV